MSKYKKHIAVLVVLALAYYFFFYKKSEDVVYLDGDLDLDSDISTKPGSNLPKAEPSKTKGGQLPISVEKRMVKMPVNSVPTNAGKWYGRNYQAAAAAARDTGCTVISGANGTFGCF